MNPKRRLTAMAHASMLLLAAGLALPVTSARAHGDESHGQSTAAEHGGHMMMGTDRLSRPDMPNMRMPSMNPSRGRKLFVDKGCVACHAINGVGGHDATNLDAHTMRPMMNPFEFAAKMWAMAPAMIAAREEALGEQILFTGDELADIVAFVHNDEAQHSFTEADMTPGARKMMDHEHGAPGGGVGSHAEELGHGHKKTPSTGHGHSGGTN